jgi:BirA family transcriptional regulator, biotin operon repressor / biotin---[acetyl-CoA-carboxylase] ligase
LKSNPPDNLRDIHEAPADIRAELARAAGPLGIFGRRVHWLDTTTSTNDVAAHLAELGAAEGTTVAADAQTAGRGRLGRAWFSPPGAGLYVSIVLRPPGDLSTRSNPSAFLTLASGVAIAEGVRAGTGLPAEIKWPNDVMIGKRKLAGILAEAAAQGDRLQHVIVGFGVNLQNTSFPLELADRATSIEAETSRRADRAQIFTQILIAFAARYRDLQAGRFDAILSAWRALAPSLPSSWVEWDTAAGVMRGRAEDIDEHGALMVRVGNNMERLVAGEVRWVQ